MEFGAIGHMICSIWINFEWSYLLWLKSCRSLSQFQKEKLQPGFPQAKQTAHSKQAGLEQTLVNCSRPLDEWLTREVLLIVLLIMKKPRPGNGPPHISPLWSIMHSQWKVEDRCHQHNKLFSLLPLRIWSQTLPYVRNLTIMNDLCVSGSRMGREEEEEEEEEGRSSWALTCRLQRCWQRGRLKRVRRKLVSTLLLLSNIFVSMQYLLYQTLSFFPILLSVWRWYFFLAGDVSGRTRSATLRGGQVSKKHESKTLWRAKMEREVWCG